MTLAHFNGIAADQAESMLLQCCGSRAWVRMMAAARPFASPEHLAAAAERIFLELQPADWLEAFAAHLRVGQAGGERKDGRAGRDALEEQRGALTAPQDVQKRMASANRAYEARFGYIFIICATGRSGAEMLGECERRLSNEPAAELAVAAEEQRKITRLRLAKMFESRSARGA